MVELDFREVPFHHQTETLTLFLRLFAVTVEDDLVWFYFGLFFFFFTHAFFGVLPLLTFSYTYPSQKNDIRLHHDTFILASSSPSISVTYL